MKNELLRLFNDEREKKRYYDAADALLAAEGIKNIKADRKQFTIKADGEKNLVRIATKRFTRYTVGAAELRKLKKIPNYVAVYDRYMRVKQRPLYEWGYIEFEVKEENKR